MVWSNRFVSSGSGRPSSWYKHVSGVMFAIACSIMSVSSLLPGVQSPLPHRPKPCLLLVPAGRCVAQPSGAGVGEKRQDARDNFP